MVEVQAKEKNLDPEMLQYIKSWLLVEGEGTPLTQSLRLIWDKCPISIGQQCQILRNKEKKEVNTMLVHVYVLMTRDPGFGPCFGGKS